MISQNLIDQLKRHEGYRAKPYRDSVGKLTVGYGRNLDDVGISEDEASYLLAIDLTLASQMVDSYMPDIRKHPVRYDVLVNMAFNMGITRLLGFKKMIAAIKPQDYESAADEMLDSKWAMQVKHRAIELSRQMRTGEYQNDDRNDK